MKKVEHPIDQLFREALTEQEIAPSDGARKAFLKEAASLPPPAAGRKKQGLIWLSGIALLLIFGITAGLWVSFSGDEHAIAISSESTSVQSKNSEIQKINQESRKSATTAISNQSLEEANPVQKLSSGELNNAPSTIKKQPVKPAETSLPLLDENENMSVPPVETAEGISDAKTIAPTGDLQTKPEERSSIKTDTIIIDTLKNEVKSGDTSTFTPPVIIGQLKKSSRQKGNFSFDVGASYTPEWVFNTLEQHNFVNNFGLDLQFRYGPFSVRTGAGGSIFKGTNELVVSYNDYLGTYSKLDSMDFTWSEPIHKYLPTYFMSSQDVWDSLLRIEEARIVKRYTYLQVPLIFGYEMVKGDRFTLGLRVGPVLSVLLNTKQLSSAYDAGKNRIIHINDISPGQVSLNWQVMGGITGAIRLNERLRFELEPSARYYFNSVYEKPVDQAKPWSIGIRTALMIEL